MDAQCASCGRLRDRRRGVRMKVNGVGDKGGAEDWAGGTANRRPNGRYQRNSLKIHASLQYVV